MRLLTPRTPTPDTGKITAGLARRRSARRVEPTVRAHVMTTSQLAGIMPSAARSIGAHGRYLGDDIQNGTAFRCDPFSMYANKVVTSPNMLVAGFIGSGKSSLVKCLLFRCWLFGRRVVVLDVKGEYARFAKLTGADVYKLTPGGRWRINPLDIPLGGGPRDKAIQNRRRDRLAMARTLIEIEMGRTMDSRAKSGMTEALIDVETEIRRHEPTIDVLALQMLHPSDRAAEALGTTPDRLADECRDAALALRNIVHGELSGMFDGDTTPGMDLAGDAVILDLSDVYMKPAQALVMTCTDFFLNRAIRKPGAQTIKWVEEAWALLRDVPTARRFAADFKLSRDLGLANGATVHNFSDLEAAGSAGSEQERLAKGLLSGTEIRFCYWQPHDQLPATQNLLGLTGPEAAQVGRNRPGQSLVRVGSRSTVLRHVRSEIEEWMTDTDEQLAGGEPVDRLDIPHAVPA